MWVDNPDVVHAEAPAEGAAVVTGLSTDIWGIQGSRVRDPFRNVWWIQTSVEHVSGDETERRMATPEYAEEHAASTAILDREVWRLAAARAADNRPVS